MKSPMHFKPSIPGTLLRILGVVVVAALLIGAVVQIRPARNAEAISSSTCTSFASGNWNDSANWTCTGGATFPGSGDTAVIDGQAIDLSANQAVKDVSISDTATLTIPDGITLTVGGTLDVAGSANLLSVGDTDGGTVAFGPDGSQTLNTNGAWLNFWNLSKTGSGSLAVNSCKADLSECAGGFEVFNTLTLTGTGPSTYVSLRSANDGVSWTFVPENVPTINFVDVKDSTNQGLLINVTNGINSGNNSGWNFIGLSSSLNPSLVEQEVILTMVLPGPPYLDSQLTFKEGIANVACTNSEGAVVNPVPVINGIATCEVSELGPGTHTITVVYTGGTASIDQVVSTATNLDIHTSQSPSAKGASVTFTASVMPTNAAGTVNFLDNGGAIVACTGRSINPVTGLATCTIPFGAVGSHVITAEFVPSAPGTEASSSGPLVQIVKNVTTAAVGSSNLKVDRYQHVILTATISPAAGGTVTFMENGNLIAGCVNVAVVSGQAACDVSSLKPGSHTITVFYGGDDTSFSSVSPAIVQKINSVVFMPLMGKGTALP